jgi:peroxiredoxin
VVVGISIDDDREALTRMVERQGLPWPQIFDGRGYEGAVPTLYNLRSIPTHYVIDREGRIAAARVEWNRLETVIRTLLGK